jgi:hypothetical protein
MSNGIRTLEGVIGSLPSGSHKIMAKLKVRECDEEPKGTFIAYVDDGELSYDVKIETDNRGQLLKHSCDCKKGKGICLHEAALMAFVLSSKRSKGKGKATKTEAKRPFHAMLEAIDHDELKVWMAELLTKNKDLELSFYARFKAGNTSYTSDDIQKLILDGKKAILKNRRKADVSEVKKLVDTWKGLHQPILDACVSDPVSEGNLKLITAIVVGVLDQHAVIESNSKGIVKYAHTVMKCMLDPVLAIVSPSSWQDVVVYFAKQAALLTYPASGHFMRFLLDLAAVSDVNRKRFILETLMQHGRSFREIHYKDTVNQLNELLGFTVEAALFADHHQFFKPITYENEYNLKLIDALIAIGCLDGAESIALKQIKANVRGDFDYPYLMRLKEIYQGLNNISAMVVTLEKLFAYHYDFDDYLLIRKFKDPASLDKWELKVFTQARLASSQGSIQAECFCFSYLHDKGNFAKLIDLIKEARSIVSFIHFFDALFQFDAEGLLVNILKMSNRNTVWWNYEISDTEFIDAIALNIKDQYTDSAIKKALVNSLSNATSRRQGKLYKLLM